MTPHWDRPSPAAAVASSGLPSSCPCSVCFETRPWWLAGSDLSSPPAAPSWGRRVAGSRCSTSVGYGAASRSARCEPALVCRPTTLSWNRHSDSLPGLCSTPTQTNLPRKDRSYIGQLQEGTKERCYDGISSIQPTGNSAYHLLQSYETLHYAHKVYLTVS